MQRNLVCLAAALLCLSILACGSAEQPTSVAATAPASLVATELPAAPAEASATPPLATQPEATQSPSADTPSPTATLQPVASESPTPVVKRFESVLPVGDLDGLDSYRAMMLWLPQNPEGTSYTLREEWVRAEPARHQVLFDTLSGSEWMPVFDALMVQGSTWLRVGEAWIPLEQAEFDGIVAQWAALPRDADAWLPEGSDVVNGIQCQRYRSVGSTTIPLSDPQSRETVNAGIQGEIWLADEPGWPPFLVRERSQIEADFIPVLFFGGGTLPPTGSATLVLEYDLTEVNSEIAIEPPE